MTMNNLNKTLILLASVALFSTPAIAESVAPGDMPAYCRGQASK